MDIGPYRIDLLDAGRFRLDGGAMFGVVPRPLWEGRMPPDDRNRIQLATQLLLIRGRGRTILVDTGMGTLFSDKYRDIYAIDQSRHNLKAALAALEVAPETVSDVILTHLHFDHAGGAVERDGDGELRPAFPRARYHVQRRQLSWALQPSSKDRGSYLPDTFQPLQAHQCLDLLDGGGEFLPGIDLIPVEGHTIAQQMVLVHDHDQAILYAGDLVPTAAHVPVPWVMAFDIHPLATIKEKQHYLHMAAWEGWRVVFQHDPETPCATITETERGFAVGEFVAI